MQSLFPSGANLRLPFSMISKKKNYKKEYFLIKACSKEYVC